MVSNFDPCPCSKSFLSHTQQDIENKARPPGRQLLPSGMLCSWGMLSASHRQFSHGGHGPLGQQSEAIVHHVLGGLGVFFPTKIGGFWSYRTKTGGVSHGLSNKQDLRKWWLQQQKSGLWGCDHLEIGPSNTRANTHKMGLSNEHGGRIDKDWLT